jgi:thiol-disulfide isomerase/thioredoxin
LTQSFSSRFFCFSQGKSCWFSINLTNYFKDKASGGKSSGGSGGSGNKGKSGKGSTILTDSNFRSKVIEGGDPWLVEFYAPWCGHCQRLEPEWKSAANTVAAETGGKVKLGHLDATQAQQIAGQYGIQGKAANIVIGLGNLSTKNRLRDRFSGSKCRQVSGQGFQERISDRKAEQVFKTETEF